MKNSESLYSEAKQFKTFRKALGISQEDMAEELKITQSEISKYENGIYDIPKDVVKYLHKKYNLNYKWYFHREGKMRDNEKEPKTIITDLKILREDMKYLSEKVQAMERSFKQDIKFLASKLE